MSINLLKIANDNDREGVGSFEREIKNLSKFIFMLLICHFQPTRESETIVYYGIYYFKNCQFRQLDKQRGDGSRPTGTIH